MVQNLRAYFVPTIKWVMCVQENNEVYSTLQRPRLRSIKISDLSVATKKTQQNKMQIYFPGVAKTGDLLSRGSVKCKEEKREM